MKMLTFPLDAKSGTLGFVSGEKAAQQAVLAITRTNPGELPLSRDFGVWIDYNLHYTAPDAMKGRIVGAIESWYPDIEVRSAEVQLSDEGREAQILVDLSVVGE